MPRVSVIMPVFNSENFIRFAIESVLKQTFNDFELILINDASTDNSGIICNEFSKADSRIQVIHLTTNLGICGARNVGLDLAKGEYIAFCDDDDICSTNLLEINYNLAKEYNADMVKFGRKLIDELDNGEVIREKETSIPRLLVYKEDELVKNFFYIRSLGMLINVWNGLYKQKMIYDYKIKFNERMKFGSEDADFSMRCYLKTKVLVVNPEICYTHFRRNAFSVSRKFDLNKIMSLIMTAETEANIWNKLELTEENRIQTICAVNSYIINIILFQLLHKDCDLTKREKINIISSLKKFQHLNYQINKKDLIKLFQKNPKQALFTFLYKRENYRALLSMLGVYHVILGEKW